MYIQNTVRTEKWPSLYRRKCHINIIEGRSKGALFQLFDITYYFGECFGKKYDLYYHYQHHSILQPISYKFWIFNTLGSMLQVNPTTRPTVEDVHAELIALALDNNIDMKAPVVVCIYF